MGENGEFALQGWVLALGLAEPLVCLDIGANIGDWTSSLVEQSIRRGRHVVVHAFEPTRETFEVLTLRLHALGSADVHAYNLAITSCPGDVLLHSLGPSQGRNSLFPPMTGEQHTAQLVGGTSVDEFIDRNQLSVVHFVKCDTEGHDPLVLQGARSAFEQERIRVFQFEYNERWIQARAYLHDVFNYIQGLPYQLGRLRPHGIEWMPQWHAELDRFFEANYVLAHTSVANKLPGVFGHFDRFNTYTSQDQT